MSHFTAVFDACVLYPAPLRDLLLRMAVTGILRARWTHRIHDEWTRAVLAKRPELAEEPTRTRTLMDDAVPDRVVTGHEPLETGLQLPDPDDRHVLAAAILCHAGTIVAYSLRDFPPTVLSPYGITAQHPGEFVLHALDLHPAGVCAAVRAQRESLRNPPRTAEDLLDTLLSMGLAESVAQLRRFPGLLRASRCCRGPVPARACVAESGIRPPCCRESPGSLRARCGGAGAVAP